MITMDSISTIEAKKSFERICHSYNVVVKHYHCGYGLFDTKAFKTSVEQAHQSITFCGVNSHHQNWKAERLIKDVTTGAMTALLHSAHRWPKAIHPSLCHCALKHYINLRNKLPSTCIRGGKDGRNKIADKCIDSLISKLSGFETKVNL